MIALYIRLRIKRRFFIKSVSCLSNQANFHNIFLLRFANFLQRRF